MQTSAKYNNNKSRWLSVSSGRKGDILMEAGRLAAEYLVSQGLLPPSALVGPTSTLTRSRRRRFPPTTATTSATVDATVDDTAPPPPQPQPPPPSINDNTNTNTDTDADTDTNNDTNTDTTPPTPPPPPPPSSSSSVPDHHADSDNNSNNTTPPQSQSQPVEVIDLEESDTDLPPISLGLGLGQPKQSQTPTIYPEAETEEGGYGLMISELLHNDFTSVPILNNTAASTTNPNPPHQSTETDDDSIYMSLGEIPLTYLRPWEQPPAQEYEKPF